MGFERICAVLQGKSSNYDTDVFTPILSAIAERSTEVKSYEAADEKEQIAMRVVADHMRTLAFAIADGAQPGNTGAGYVIRRILRRAVRYGYQTLGFREPFMADLVGTLIEVMGEAFPELDKNRDFIERVIRAEEEGFLRTLEPGVDFFNRFVDYIKRFIAIKKEDPLADAPSAANMQRDESARQKYREISEANARRTAAFQATHADLLSEIKSDRVVMRVLEVSYPGVMNPWLRTERTIVRGYLPGEIVFVLHDTYGFPSDLTALMAREQGLSVDMERFEELMDEQRNRARAAGNFKSDYETGFDDLWQVLDVGQVKETAEEQLMAESITKFVGYDTLVVEEAPVYAVRSMEYGTYQVVLKETPFYAESGGQVSDSGWLTFGDERVEVIDTHRFMAHIVHTLERIPRNKPDVGSAVRAEVDTERRFRIMRHHTATHILHAALRETLGAHVQQKGSLVAPDRLRFDFSHFERVTDDEQKQIERRVNEIVLRNLTFGDERSVPIDEARERGAMMLFGEKYGDLVRVVTFEGAGFSSIELCGGTHVQATGEVGLFKLTSEGSVASGIRRVEAVAGEKALEWLDAQMSELDATRGLFKQLPDGLSSAVVGLQEQTKSLEKELAAFKQGAASAGLDELIAEAQDVNGIRLITGEIPGADMRTLSDLGEQIREQLQENTVAVLGSANLEEGKAYLVASVTDDLVKNGIQAGKIVGALAKIVGGGGGGRPHLATAGGKQPEHLAEALAAASTHLP